ncbi:hypothetical protein MJO28_007871 [Puccinia striiformis f. sp. tritici]|uniref:Uncharacterized protein n=1 Tax=Puccinia striiformis f. sp. tritici TaxID=168172 RepID=A0ACC0EF77_9BASI|nr:hypothetical protein MJO28_007871 [Puccinia striiformis f. sp. tritici]
MNQLTLSNRLRQRTTKGVTIRRKLDEMKDESLKYYIKTKAFEKYQQEPKPLQVEAVFNLARGLNTFLLAGTGYGKSRISEMYFDMIPQSQRPVVLVLNPLDALGENQVLEKNLAGYTAINLTKMNFDANTSADILTGYYNFIYLSPEIYLNSKSFDHIYFSPTFQNRLATIVIDEAHVIFIWGLVESSTSKTRTTVHGKHEDYACFRPGYGKIGPHILFRNDKPLLLLSATCRPVAVEAIKKCLKLNDSALAMLEGELTRPEIRIIRVDMDNSLASTLDLIKAFPSAKDVPDEDMVPTLIYSGSRNRTLTAMEVFDLARETPGACFVPRGKTIRRFHSCTGDQDKKDVVEDFSSAKVPVISCTMALGLGQNWKRDRMDALAITPLCLRVAFSMDNLLGYIPLWHDDPAYVREKERQESEGICRCLCSNCEPTKSKTLVKNLVFANKDNFDNILQDTYQPTEARDLTHKYPPKRVSLRKRKVPEAKRPIMEEFMAQLTTDLHKHYDTTFGAGGPLGSSDIFGAEEADAIATYMHHIRTPGDIRGIIGGECFDGQLLWLFEAMSSFKTQQEKNTTPVPKKKARVTSAPACLSTNAPRFTRHSGVSNTTEIPVTISPVVGPRPPSKTALEAAAAAQRSLERKAQQERTRIAKQNRKDQLASFLKEGLESAQKDGVAAQHEEGGT